MDRDEAFLLATGRVLPAAIQPELQGPERYAIGNVVYHSAKPTIVSWRKQNVQFATVNDGDPTSLSDLFAPECGDPLNQIHLQSTLFSNSGGRDTTREFRTQRAGRSSLMRASFGAIYQTTSNLLGILDSKAGELKLDLGSPVVQKVLENGGQFFVVSTVYEAEKLEISEREDSDISKWMNVVSKPDKTVLGFLLVQLSVSSDGVLRSVWHGGYTPRSIEESEDGPSVELEEVDFVYAYRQYGSRELQVFKSNTYGGVIDEAAEFVKALTANSTLQKEFVEALKRPRGALIQLSQELWALQERLMKGSGDSDKSESSFPELMAQLSTQPPKKLDQVKALGIASEAFKELSPAASKRILSLTVEEKQTLFNLFKELPLGSSAHTFLRPALSTSDELFTQILDKIGFGVSGGRLSYQGDESGVDLVAVTITAIQATSQ